MPPRKILSIETLSQPAGRVMLPANHSPWLLAVPFWLVVPAVEMPSIEYIVESMEPACVIYLLHTTLIKLEAKPHDTLGTETEETTGLLGHDFGFPNGRRMYIPKL